MRRLAQPAGIIVHHRDNKKNEINSHFIITAQGGEAVLLTGCPLQEQSSFCELVEDHISICVDGDYNKVWTKDIKLDLLIKLIRGLLIIYPHLTLKDLHYHDEYGHISCPGVRFPRVEAVRLVIMLCNR